MFATWFTETRKHPIPGNDCDIEVPWGKWMLMSKGEGEFAIQSHEWTRRETLSRGVCRQLTFFVVEN